MAGRAAVIASAQRGITDKDTPAPFGGQPFGDRWIRETPAPPPNTKKECENMRRKQYNKMIHKNKRMRKRRIAKSNAHKRMKYKTWIDSQTPALYAHYEYEMKGDE